MKKTFWTVLFLCMIFSVVFATGDINEEYEYIVDENYDYSLGYYDAEDESEDIVYENVMMRAKVIEAGKVYDYKDEYSDIATPCQDISVKILDDRMKDTVLDIQYSLSYYADNVMVADPLGVGDKVYIYANFEDGEMIEEAYVAYVDKQASIWWLVAIYAFSIVLIGGLKGLKALISLIITILAIFLFAIPQIFNGANALLVTIFTSIIIIIITLVIISGFGKKTWAATIGTAAGIILAGLIAIIFGNVMKLSGIDEESYMLTTADISTVFDFKGIMFSAIIIGALGACMDVGMSIASAMEELKKESPNISRKRLFRAGMNIGKDMMGTMTNTLILAYVGSSICTILLFMGFKFELFEILNQEKIAEEILRSLAGSMGLICTIPLTALVSSFLMGNSNDIMKEERKDYGRE